MRQDLNLFNTVPLISNPDKHTFLDNTKRSRRIIYTGIFPLSFSGYRSSNSVKAAVSGLFEV